MSQRRAIASCLASAHARDQQADAALGLGGLMVVGSPHHLIDELIRQGRRDLAIIANGTAKPELVADQPY